MIYLQFLWELLATPVAKRLALIAAKHLVKASNSPMLQEGYDALADMLEPKDEKEEK